jgi:hypothetical protein
MESVVFYQGRPTLSDFNAFHFVPDTALAIENETGEQSVSGE